MDRDAGMAASVVMPDSVPAWLPDAELAVYTAEFARTGLQGGLNWYRLRTTPGFSSELEVFAGQRITVPTAFIAGAQDWGIHQSPGALEAMQTRACADFRGIRLIDRAGHWVQQEQPAAVVAALIEQLRA